MTTYQYLVKNQIVNQKFQLSDAGKPGVECFFVKHTVLIKIKTHWN